MKISSFHSALLGLFVFSSTLTGQDFPSIEDVDDTTDLYPYVLPIMGDAVAARGIGLPLPFGIMVNTFAGNQFLELRDLSVGINNSDMINLDEIVQFDRVKATAYSPNVRLDAWILPFLNVYTIAGYGVSEVNVNIQSPFQLSTTTTAQGGFFGFGVNASAAYQNVFFNLDINRQYIFSDKLEEPAEMAISGVRVGYIFRSQKDVERNWVLWTGAMHTELSSETVGRINLTEVFPNATEQIGQWQTGLDDWYTGLPPVLQNRFEDQYNRLSDGLTELENGVDNGVIRYEMQKVIPQPWNLLFGVQYQPNKRWQFRAEWQTLGDRDGALLSLNYRFGIPGKTLFGQ
jgi:hypothetical protein